MTESDLTHRLRTHYCAPEWAFLAQVRNGTGFSRRTTRTADGLAMSLWPSRGLHMHGFEIKVSRSDFVKELKTPDKAEDIARFCHFWWIVAPDVNVAPVDMVPQNWGLIVCKEDGLRIAKQATFKEGTSTPDFIMLASLFRNVHESMMPIDALAPWKADLQKTINDQAKSNAEHQWKHQVDALTDGVRNRTEVIAKFEKLLGCRLTEYSVEHSAATFKLAHALRTRGSNVLHALREMISAAEHLKPAVEEAAKEIEAVRL